MKSTRPKNLNLFTIRFPVTAIVSILHRISGVILFLFVPLALWVFHLSVSSEQGFATVHAFFVAPIAKLLIFCILSSFIFHFFAGIRHLLMDIHIGEELSSGRFTSYLTLTISIILMILLGVWLW